MKAVARATRLADRGGEPVRPWPESADGVAALPATQTRRTQAQAPANPQDALHHFLHGLPTDVLADKVLQLARHNLDLRHELERWHMLSAIAEYSRECEAGAPADPAPQEADLRNQERQRAKHEALALSRRQFDLDPGVPRYHQVLKAGKAAGDDCALLRLT